ncbi:small acid-soluble spore protein O [Pontibacillus yanchengensis]|uniref:Small, acid-soluble spore protein O n=1 Tax=Pontibacillus yanchengensis Y32 TaxID=1385514 RepID=A0A0A2TCE0_9BACI|nr:small acid-soluble spore protein O [Pontibacillus yanchengensis]KGP73487.1 acid-soluble spore protein O [Pontibacillus yanchengensis Y32]
MNSKRKANHSRPGMNAAKAQGNGAGYNEEIPQQPLKPEERMNNKKRKKNQ